MADERREPVLQAADALPALHSFTCPACGGVIELRALGHSVTAACGSCRALIDVNDERYQLIERTHLAEQVATIPLGTRGWIEDGLYEVIGYLQRQEGTFTWDEYLLFNPYLGFRWLVEADGHWNFVTMLRETVASHTGQPSIRYQDKDFYCFNSGVNKVTYVLGEFYWRIKIGETVTGTDYICPPYMLSAEESDDEIVWSIATYVAPQIVQETFGAQLDGTNGIGANQPSPFTGGPGAAWKTAGLAIIATLLVAIVMGFVHSTVDLYNGSVSPAVVGNKQTNVLASFHIPDMSGEVSVTTRAMLNNSWTEINYSLVNKQTNESYDFTQALEYYSGSDSDGAWSEGSWTTDGELSAIPGGDYDLVADIAYGDTQTPPGISFDIRRHPHSWQPFLITIGLLLIYPLVVSGLQFGFERTRRSNSDYDATGVYKAEEHGNSDDN